MVSNALQKVRECKNFNFDFRRAKEKFKFNGFRWIYFQFKQRIKPYLFPQYSGSNTELSLESLAAGKDFIGEKFSTSLR